MAQGKGNKPKQARFDKEDEKEFYKLQARLGLVDLYGGESETLKRAVRLANCHLDLKDRLKEMFSGLL